MATAFDFIKAICLEPEDMTPRLMYADWLEERGDPRGEFIRVQIELAAMSVLVPEPRVGHNPAVDALRHRERWLWTPRNYVNWVPLFLHQGSGTGIASLETSVVALNFTVTGSVISCAQLAFRRGFIEAVRCRLADWHGRPCLRCVEFGGAYFDQSPHRDCIRCHGTGRVNAHGPQIVACCPVMQIETIGWSWPVPWSTRTSGMPTKNDVNGALLWAREKARKLGLL